MEFWYKDPAAKDIKAALRQSIKAHGPITLEDSSLNSAVKRLFGVLKAERAGVYKLRALRREQLERG